MNSLIRAVARLPTTAPRFLQFKASSTALRPLLWKAPLAGRSADVALQRGFSFSARAADDTIGGEKRPGRLTLAEELGQPTANGEPVEEPMVMADELVDPMPGSPKGRGSSWPAGAKPTVFIQNIAYSVTDESLSNLLNTVGGLQGVRISRDSRGLSKGFAFADFATIEDATRAIEELNGAYHNDRMLKLRPSEAVGPRRNPAAARGRAGGDRPYPARRWSDDGAGPADELADEKLRQIMQDNQTPSTTLYVGNIAFDATAEQVADALKHLDGITAVRVSIDYDTGRPKGFAHVDLADKEAAQKAKDAIAEMAINGRALLPHFARARDQLAPRRPNRRSSMTRMAV